MHMPSFLVSFRPLGFVLMLAMPVVAAQAQPAAQARAPVSSFFQQPAFSSPLLSPNGKMLAITVGKPGQRTALTVLDLATSQVHAAAQFSDIDIGQVQWVNNTRLLFNTADRRIAPGEQMFAPGLYAVNADGSGLKELAPRRGGVAVARPGSSNGKIQPRTTQMFPQPGAQDSDQVYVARIDTERGAGAHNVDLLLLDTHTARASKVVHPDHTVGWLLDHKGEPRLITTLDGAVQTLQQRDPASGAWKKVASSRLYSFDNAAGTPLAFGPDGTLYVSTSAGKDKRAVHALDLATGKLSEKPLIVLEDYDFQGRLIISNGKLLGFRAVADSETTNWFDPAMRALQEEIDRQLGQTVNLVSVATRSETPWVLVESYSDVQPRMLMLYNTATKKFSKVGAARPWIDPAAMGRQQMVRYKARDGLDIPALLTVPASASGAKLPLVVLVHGGPWVRGASWGWRADAQFLASRGYAVLEPDFRGSTGHGHAHFKAGLKQWGLAMQNDIADGARWAIAQGLADPKRICIAGASYGGYATLMGLVNDPDLYQCGVNWVGVTDINLIYDGAWNYRREVAENWLAHGMPEMVGDQVKDAAQLEATSPLKQAARIKQPLLLAYGEIDPRVPLYHGEKFYKAVRQTNSKVEWVVYPNEGHGWAKVENQIDFWSRVEKFLERHIGKP